MGTTAYAPTMSRGGGRGGVFRREQRNQDATCWVGNLHDSVTEDLLHELFTQAGPVVHVFMPRDKVTDTHSGYAFVEMRTELDAEYAARVMNMIRLFDKPLRVNMAGAEKRREAEEVGANLFIGSLAEEVDEKLLYDTFSAFGGVLGAPRVVRDQDTGAHRGFAFVHYDSFESADAAIASMHGQFLAGQAITVQYAFKKDSRERHGSQAERLLAAQHKQMQARRPRNFRETCLRNLRNLRNFAACGTPAFLQQRTKAPRCCTHNLPQLQLSRDTAWNLDAHSSLGLLLRDPLF